MFNIARPKDTNLCTTIYKNKEIFDVYYDDPFSPVNTIDKQFYESLKNKSKTTDHSRDHTVPLKKDVVSTVSSGLAFFKDLSKKDFFEDLSPP